MLSLLMFGREIGQDILKSVTEYRIFHFALESLAARTTWPDGRKKVAWRPRTTYKVATECISFFRWAYSFKFNPHKVALEDPEAGHMFKKGDDNVPEFWEWDSLEMRRLFNHPANNVRDICMLETLRCSGLRITECCSLILMDFNKMKTDKTVRVRNGKGGKDGFAPLDKRCIEKLEIYFDDLRVMGYTDMDPAFPSSIKRKTHYIEGSARKWMYTRGNDLNIHAYPHRLRHSVAGELLDRGEDLLTVAEVLRHKDINTTRRYTHIKANMIKNIYDRDPADRRQAAEKSA